MPLPELTHHQETINGISMKKTELATRVADKITAESVFEQEFQKALDQIVERTA